MSVIKRWFTCTPVRFAGDETFFARDSGLLCRGFQEIGMPCQAVMPGPPMEGDAPADLIRTDYKNLRNPAWWRSLQGEGVVLYAWGAACYLPIARAIRQAGMKLVCSMDTSGTFGILGGARAYWGAQWRILNGLGTTPASLLLFALKFLSSFTWSLGANDLGRARHLRQATLIGAVSPIAAERLRRVCLWYGGRALASRIRMIPHPVSPHMNYSGQPKSSQVVAVGRWLPLDWRQKNPGLLMEVMGRVLLARPNVACVVVGAMEKSLQDKFQERVGEFRGRLRLLGRIPNRDLAGILQGSQVSLCSSNHESFHIASAEALCCGCSVVAPDLPELPSFPWFVSAESGRLAARNPESMARAVVAELDLWAEHGRNPFQISTYWKQPLHAARVAQNILTLLERKKAHREGGFLVRSAIFS